MTVESQKQRIIFEDRPTWIPGMLMWFLGIFILSYFVDIKNDANVNDPVGKLATMSLVMMVFALFSWARSRRARTTLTDTHLIIRRGLFIVTRYEIPLTEITCVTVKEPWMLKGVGRVWQFMDSYGTLEVFTLKHPELPYRAENLRQVYDKAEKIEHRITKPSES
ncbi:MAG: PH domain-containing protein [Dehalococcoidia bacterium]|nr:PH domain-containing protein [Dehalococcoidia bacterium]